jgi:hypothetical protein
MTEPTTSSAVQIDALKKELYEADDCLFCYPEPIGRRHENGCPISRLLGYCKEMEKKQSMVDEALGLVKSTAKGALVASERDKNAMKKAMEAIGLLNSMVEGGEKHSDVSKKKVEEAVVDLLHAMQFKAEKPKGGSQLSSTISE